VTACLLYEYLYQGAPYSLPERVLAHPDRHLGGVGVFREAGCSANVTRWQFAHKGTTSSAFVRMGSSDAASKRSASGFR
jgi:hypothetical protein